MKLLEKKEERVRVTFSEFLKVDSIVLKALNNFQSFSANDLECLEGSCVQVDI